MNRKIKTIILPAILLLALFAMPGPVSDYLKSRIRDMFAPFFSSAAQVFDFSDSVFERRINLIASNMRMNKEVVALKAELVTMQYLEKDNLMLRKQLGFYSPRRGSLIPAEIIGRDFSGWWQTVVLNRGSVHGTAKGSAVVSDSGLTGRILTTSGYTSEALLLSDPACKVSVVFPETGAFGILSGQGVDFLGQVVCRVEFVSKDMAVKRGARVVTSGLGGMYPAGIPVGIVKDIHRDRTDLFQYVDVVPSADLSALKYVFIINGQNEAIGESAGKQSQLISQGVTE